jgi:hypothetical protein
MQVGQSALSLFRLWRRVAVPNLQQLEKEFPNVLDNLKKKYLIGGPTERRGAELPPRWFHHWVSVVVCVMSGLRSTAHVSHAVSETPSPSLQ